MLRRLFWAVRRDPAVRFSLRDLPGPAKLVVAAFLMAVGLGYVSAMVQLHMQHSDRDGSGLPTAENVIAVFAGKRWQKGEKDGAGPPPRSKFEELLSGDPTADDLTSKNMTPALFALDAADYQKRRAENPADAARLDAERHGERLALLAWATSAPAARKKAHDEDRFTLPKDRVGQPLTTDWTDKDNPETVKVRTLLLARCVRCHKEGSEAGSYPLRTYDQLMKYLPTSQAVPPEGGYVDSGKLMSLEKLTQSTHAHLLSFAVLFALTGLTFAFTGYPAAVRAVIAPVVLVAQVADVSCWWLARLDGVGPYFAMTILATGAVVGLGLSWQIVFSLFDLYGNRGKAVLGALFLLAAGAGGVLYVAKVAPFLKNERDEKEQLKAAAPAPVPATAPPKAAAGVSAGPSELEQFLTGPAPAGGRPWGGRKAGVNMVPAFFDKDGADYKKIMKGGDEDEKRTLTAERDGERAAVLAWARAAPDARKKAYDDDAFPPPAALAGQPLTADYRADGGAVKVKSILNDRCGRCHFPDGEQKEFPLDTYDGLLKYLGPTAAPADGKGATAPIPAAKDE